MKDYADTINYLRDNRLLTLETLQSRLSSLESSFDTLTGSMKAKSIRMKDLHELLRQGENYFRLKPVHEELNRIKWKRQRERFKADHDSDLRLFYAARRILREKLGDKPVTLQEWNREYLRLESEYADLLQQYKPLKEELAKLRSVQYHVNRALNDREPKQQTQRNIEGR